MKKLSLSWAALSLLPPLLVLCCIFYGTIWPGSVLRSFAASTTPTPGPKSANVQVGFITTISGVPPSGLQNVFLNVVAVRLNPKPKTGDKNQVIPGENDAAWQSIPVPAGVGVGLSSKPGDLQIDMIAGQGILQNFNTAGIRPNRYKSVELLLDTSSTGTIVPVCSSGGALEGCINYPIVLQNSGNQISFISSSDIVTAKNTLTQLPLNLQLVIVNKPTAPNGFYVANVVAAPAPGNASQFVANITGSVSGAEGNSTVKKIRHLSVAAELPGTNTIIASADVVNGQYTLVLPASADLGTLYDFFVSGGSATFAAARGIAGVPGGLVFPGKSFTQDFTVDGDQVLGTIGGQIKDGCTHLPLPGATLKMLQAPSGSSADCTVTPEQCVSVAYTTTDNGGRYPLPGTFQQPAYFNNVPISPPTPALYTIQISAPGYDSRIIQGQASGTNSGTHAGVCSGTLKGGECTFELSTAYIQGSLSLEAAPAPSTSINVQVFAEQAGTNQLVSALETPLLFKPGLPPTLTFMLNVPTQVPSFDLFASAADLYQGATDPYPGHSIITLPNVANAPTACAMATPAFTESMACVGHTSLTGTVVNPDSGTTVALSKNGVRLLQSAVGPATPAPSTGNTYSFCAPPDDTYTLQRLEQGAPAGPSVAVGMLATPAPTSSPCPSTCFSQNTTNTCPGLCGNVVQSPL